MSGRHEGPPLGSAAREATAPPYHGKHRAEGTGEQLARLLPSDADWSEKLPESWKLATMRGTAAETAAQALKARAEVSRVLAALDRGEDWPPDDPPRCWSCGHRFGDGCECACCNDTHDGGPDDV